MSVKESLLESRKSLMLYIESVEDDAYSTGERYGCDCGCGCGGGSTWEYLQDLEQELCDIEEELTNLGVEF